MKTGFTRYLMLTYFTCLLFTEAAAQVKGLITDELTHQPVANVSVYVSNTTYGCQSSEDGHFLLQAFPVPPFQLTISSVGYESATYQVKETPGPDISIALRPKSAQIGEVVILSPEKDGWEKFGKEFIRNFIGYSAFAKECEIINKKDIVFRYDQKANKLLASSPKPLQIRNKATGYMITYWLEDYEMNYSTRKLFFKGNAQFEPLVSKNGKMTKRWKANREASFNGSLNHFMRSVFNNTVYEDSFELRVYKRIPAAEYGKMVPFKTEYLAAANDSVIRDAVHAFLHYSDSDFVKLLQPIQKWLEAEKPYAFTLYEKLQDSSGEIRRKLTFNYNTEKPQEKIIQYFDYDFVPEDSAYAKTIPNIQMKDSAGNPVRFPRIKPASFAYLWKQKVPLDSFITRTADHKVFLKFKDFIQVTYLKEQEEPEYINRFSSTPRNAGTQQSIISVDNENGIQVLEDGNFTETYDLMAEEYWSFEKLDKMLPLDYRTGD